MLWTEAHPIPVSVETVIAYKYLARVESEKLTVAPRLRRDIEMFFGSIASDVKLFVGKPSNVWNLPAYCEGRSIVLDRTLLKKGPNVVRSTLAHEFAHALQQRHSWDSPTEFVSVVEDRVLEAEAENAARCFLRGEGCPTLTTIPRSAYHGRRIVQCQTYGQVGQETLDKLRDWPEAPKKLGGEIKVEYAAVNSRNEIWKDRPTAFGRAKKLAGITRAANRTYHFTQFPAFNEGVQILGNIPGGENGPARVGRYYDFGAGPRGRLLIVEHTNDANALVTISGKKAVHPHFHVCTYGQHLRYEMPPAPGGQVWLQPFDAETMFMPYYSGDGFRTTNAIREYELDGRFGEVAANEHHIYY